MQAGGVPWDVSRPSLCVTHLPFRRYREEMPEMFECMTTWDECYFEACWFMYDICLNNMLMKSVVCAWKARGHPDASHLVHVFGQIVSKWKSVSLTHTHTGPWCHAAVFSVAKLTARIFYDQILLYINTWLVARQFYSFIMYLFNGSVLPNLIFPCLATNKI